MFRSFLIISFFPFLISCCPAQSKEGLTDNKLKVNFNGDAKIETGGPFVGIEMHHSSPLIQRVSFFYPVANSLDESTDYWKRDTSFIMQLGLKIGDGKKEFIGHEPFNFDLTPYSADFHKSDSDKTIDISYRFTKTKPAMVIRYEIKNMTDKKTSFEFYTHFETAIRTSHSFNLIDKAWTEYDKNNSVIYTNFEDTAAQFAQIFIANAGEKPVSFSSVSKLSGLMNPGNEWLLQNQNELPNDLLSKNNPGRPAARFMYRKTLEPQESMIITQIIGSCKQAEGKDLAISLIRNYDEEIRAYEQSVLKKALAEASIGSGDPAIDQSVYWAKAILEANSHYLDGEFVPMPCPAEYNFYFTHDVLKTDLAAVNFDIERVKRDLDFIIRHSNKDLIIPHAYYWKDTKYQTELADHDNWNNFWFINVAGSYLRHSGDTTFLRTIYPYLRKSLNQALLTKGEDNLMWSNRPDWWDIGKLYGSKAYMTILAIKAIREYLFISTSLGNDLENLNTFEQTADEMNQQLISKLWDDNLEYLINYYEPGKPDHHYYIGPLLAAHYELLDDSKVTDLVNTARKKLLDKKTGIYDVYPMDFDELGDYLHFAGNEAGDKFYYANGGIWPHGNAWYALALMKAGETEEALDFIKTNMTLKGIMEGPNGQPAMYEVRNGNFKEETIYGTVDKPQFLWAGGWYLYSLYHLYAIRENEWNISLDPFNPDPQNKIVLGLYNSGSLSTIEINGNGKYINRVLFDGQELPTAVIPVNSKYKNIEVWCGKPDNPYLQNCKSILKKCLYETETKVLTIELQSFTGHNEEVVIISPSGLSKIFVDDSQLKDQFYVESKDGLNIIKIKFSFNSPGTKLKVEFK
jgi:cellobiose phosphorylase